MDVPRRAYELLGICCDGITRLFLCRRQAPPLMYGGSCRSAVLQKLSASPSALRSLARQLAQQLAQQRTLTAELLQQVRRSWTCGR